MSTDSNTPSASAADTPGLMNQVPAEAHSVFGKSAHDNYFGREHITIIEPSRGWRALDLKALWAYRELLWVLTARDTKVRYKQTVLDFAWAIIPSQGKPH